MPEVIYRLRVIPDGASWIVSALPPSGKPFEFSVTGATAEEALDNAEEAIRQAVLYGRSEN